MVLRPPRSTRTATLVPYTTLFLSTSGVLLLARTPRAAAYFSKSFSGRTARKVYWALVVGVPEVKDGFINLPLAKQPGTGGEKMHVDEAHGLAARSRYRVIERCGNRAAWRSEEHTTELQSLMRSWYAFFWLHKYKGSNCQD